MLKEEQLLIEKLTLLNALRYKGKANPKSILGATLKENVELRPKIKEIREFLNEIVVKVNSMTLEEQKGRILEIDPDVKIEREKKVKTLNLNLPEPDKFEKVVLRLAPYPSGPLHIGNSRMVLLNDYFAKKHNGKLLLVFDDTIGSDQKTIDPQAYDMIPEDLEYLGVKCHGKYYKSDRLNLFYKYSKELIERGNTYVCTCDALKWRNNHKEEKRDCPCRNLSKEDNLERWEHMLDGTYPERGAVVRFKSSMDYPDPALRDPIFMRISEKEHPRVGSKYRVWPLLEFSWGIDDHELGMTHIIRGKDLKKEGDIEKMIWNVFGWKNPVISLYGRMKMKTSRDGAKLSLSKSKSAEMIRKGVYSDWTDPRTWTLQSLKRRGIQPDAIRSALLDLGMSMVDVQFSPDGIYSDNRKLIDKNANRYFMVNDPIITNILDLPKVLTNSSPLLHPDMPEKGTRTIKLDRRTKSLQVWVNNDDLVHTGVNNVLRLKDLANFTIENYKKEKSTLRYHSEEMDVIRKNKSWIIQWVPKKSAMKVNILDTNGDLKTGFAESDLKETQIGDIVQFERYAFCRVESIKEDLISLVYLHR